MTGNITAIHGNVDTKAAFKNCALFRRCVTHINDEHVETAENLDIIMPTYNLLGYSDNYANSSGSLWQFKRDELQIGIANPEVGVDNSSYFKYKSSSLRESTVDGANRKFKDVKIVVPLKYLSNFFRSLEMPLINCKLHLELNCSKNCVMSTAGNNDNKTTFKITSTKLHAPVDTLSTKNK